jgi:hypothetical protein
MFVENAENAETSRLKNKHENKQRLTCLAQNAG